MKFTINVVEEITEKLINAIFIFQKCLQLPPKKMQDPNKAFTLETSEMNRIFQSQNGEINLAVRFLNSLTRFFATMKGNLS